MRPIAQGSEFLEVRARRVTRDLCNLSVINEDGRNFHDQVGVVAGGRPAYHTLEGDSVHMSAKHLVSRLLAAPFMSKPSSIALWQAQTLALASPQQFAHGATSPSVAQALGLCYAKLQTLWWPRLAPSMPLAFVANPSWDSCLWTHFMRLVPKLGSAPLPKAPVACWCATRRQAAGVPAQDATPQVLAPAADDALEVGGLDLPRFRGALRPEVGPA